MEQTARIYRQLKSVRGQMKRRLKELRVKSNFEHQVEIEGLEEATRSLAQRKTFLRKKFQKLTKREGPYRVRHQ